MITEKQIQQLTNIVVKETKPERVYLFGSYASDSATENSDVDILIIVDKEFTKEERRKTVATLGLKTATKDLFFPKDFKVYSSKEFEQLRNNKESFLSSILQQSKPLYVG